jgi:hypothetical protein
MSQIHHDSFGDRGELLQELGGEPLLVEQYAEDEDVVTQFLELPLDVSFQAPPALPGQRAPEQREQPEQPEWMVALTAQDRRMLSSSQITSGLQRGELQTDMLVWRRGMSAWLPIARIGELAPRVLPSTSVAAHPARRPAPEPAPSAPRQGSAARRVPTLASARPTTPQEQIRKSKARLLPPMPPPPLAAAALLARTPVGAMDLEEASSEHPPSMRVKRAVMAMSALAMLGVFLTMYVISSGRDAKPEPDVDARPRPVRAVPAAKANRDEVFAESGERQQEAAGALLAEGEGLR